MTNVRQPLGKIQSLIHLDLIYLGLAKGHGKNECTWPSQSASSRTEDIWCWKRGQLGTESTSVIAAESSGGPSDLGLSSGPLGPPKSKKEFQPLVVPVGPKENPQLSQQQWAGTKGQCKATQCHQNTLASLCPGELLDEGEKCCFRALPQSVVWLIGVQGICGYKTLFQEKVGETPGENWQGY